MIGERTVERINQYSGRNLIKTLGITMIELSEKYAEASMPVTEDNQQTMGFLHGGATIALAETIGGIGSYAILPQEEGCVGMQISASHISSANIGDTVIAKADLIHRGKRSHIWDVNIYSEKTGRLISSIKVTNAIIAMTK
ncbi:MAG TPA: PaaI family thioesterase [Candidatus Ignatzschineria merdigallinarum]|uniref:PaaI family thioesterase n=1 Tax=Candidatus Ignatzschineria merdigallinarum TaxID=2838621 RepID=A0A9D1Q6N5_9GAMM|nr:PaaI family thioesterase [Candidatus Ignatzschineria merdigallinarum]